MSQATRQIRDRLPTSWVQTTNGYFSRLFEWDYALLVFCLAPAMALYLLIAIIPMVWAFNLSLYSVPALNPTWTWVGPGRYIEIITAPAFHTAFVKSAIFGFGSVFFQVIVGVSLALLVNKEFKGAVLARALALLPYMVPAVVVGMVGQFMLNAEYGIINRVLVMIGVLDSGIAFLGLPQFALATVAIAGSWKFAVFVTLLTLARLQSIPENYNECAIMCGANAWQKFRDVTFPRIKNVVLIAALLRTLWMFNKFDILWIMTSGGPGEATQTIPLYAFEVAFTLGDLGRASGVAAVMFLFLAGWSIVYFRVANPAQEVRV